MFPVLSCSRRIPNCQYFCPILAGILMQLDFEHDGRNFNNGGKVGLSIAILVQY